GICCPLAESPRWVPIHMITSSFFGLLLGAVAGLLFARGRAPARFSERWGITLLILAAPGALFVGLLLRSACPLYNSDILYCWWGGQDLLGGWISAAAVIAFFDLVVLGVTFLVSARQATCGEDGGPARQPVKSDAST